MGLRFEKMELNMKVNTWMALFKEEDSFTFQMGDSKYNFKLDILGKCIRVKFMEKE